MSKQTFFLVHATARSRAAQAMAHAPDGHMVVISQPARNGAQNRLLHALIGEVAERMEWAGKKRDQECWKRLFLSAWCRVRGESVEILPALDGHGVDIVPIRTSKLTKAECSDLTEFIYAWAAENGVYLPDRPAEVIV